MTDSKLLKFTPKKFQQEGIQYLLRHPYCILGDEMGLGKTFQCIAVSLWGNYNTLIVCPAHLKRNWEAEYKKFAVNCPRIIIDNKQIKFGHTEPKVFIINYEQLEKAGNLFEWADMVIADEAHYLKNLKATRTQAFHHWVSEHPPERLVLATGTPIKNRVPEFYSLARLTNGGKQFKDKVILKMSATAFAKKYCYERLVKTPYGYVSKFEGIKNKEEVRAMLKHRYIRRLSKNVLDLPPIIHKQVLVDYSKEQDDLQEDWEHFQAGSETLSACSATKADSAAIKSNYTFKYVRDLINAGEGPIVVFSDHVTASENIHERLSEEFRGEYIHGGVPSEDRARSVERFQKGRLQYLVLTIGAGSTGFTLTASCNLVFNDLSWVPADNSQALKRIHRMSQERKSTIHWILGGEVDRIITETILHKMKTIKEII